MTLNHGYPYRDAIGGNWKGIPVLTYLSTRYRHSPERVWKERLSVGQVTLDGLEVGPDHILAGSECLVWHRPPWDEPDVPLDFAVLHEDESLLAVAKPSGLPTVPAGGFLEHTLLARVRQRDPHATPVHRLGRGTSGVVLFARTRAARARLTEDFREMRITKVYRALASGHPSRARFTITDPIGPVPHRLLGSVHAVSARGKPAHSEVSLLRKESGYCLVEVRIHTGRPHQIRIHLAAAGHPLVGDPLYTFGGLPKEGSEALPGEIGYRLHAERLMLRHPVSGARMELWCAPPPELADRPRAGSSP